MIIDTIVAFITLNLEYFGTPVKSSNGSLGMKAYLI